MVVIILVCTSSDHQSQLYQTRVRSEFLEMDDNSSVGALLSSAIHLRKHIVPTVADTRRENNTRDY